MKHVYGLPPQSYRIIQYNMMTAIPENQECDRAEIQLYECVYIVFIFNLYNK